MECWERKPSTPTLHYSTISLFYSAPNNFFIRAMISAG